MDEPGTNGLAPDEVTALLPEVKVARGAPDDVELAALVAGIVAARSAVAAHGLTTDGAWIGRAQALSPWSDHARRLGQRSTGADAWRWSLAP